MALRAVPDHPKFAELKAILNQPKGSALGWLEAMWHFAGRFTPQGNIGKYSDVAIEAWVEWNGKPGELIAALVESKWIDVDSVHRLLVHDWAQHSDKATKNSLMRSKLTFCTPGVRTEIHGVRTEVPESGTAYGLPVPVPVPEPVPEPVKKQKPSPKEKPSVDVRHTEFKKSFDGYYLRMNSIPAPWDGQEGKSLSRWLIANPTITREQWNRILNNRRRSPVAQGKRLSTWIESAISWLGGIADEWGKEIKNNGSSRITSQSKQAATVEAGRTVIANLLGMDRNGVDEDWGADGGAGEPGEDFIDGERVGGYSRVVT